MLYYMDYAPRTHTNNQNCICMLYVMIENVEMKAVVFSFVLDHSPIFEQYPMTNEYNSELAVSMMCISLSSSFGIPVKIIDQR